jgi:hypothetical protein
MIRKRDSVRERDMALNLAKTVLEYLKQNSGQRFTAREIANWVYATHPNECQEDQRT